MSKSRKANRNSNPPPPAAPTRRLPREAVIVLVVAVVAAGVYWWGKGQHNDTQSAATATVEAAPTAAAANTNLPAAAAPNAAFEKLKGKWMRPDGGYVIDIKNVDASGKMEAAYFNPNPISVSQAVAAQDGAVTKVFIELQGVNYPGSTYTLVFDPGSDQLKGIYFQAKLKQQFEVYFERMARP